LSASERIPALDGLRAVSIALVLIGHLAGTRRFLTLSSIAIFGDVGNLGVCVFFVISGFLITTLIFSEQARHDRIDVRAFYIRRAFRILPAAAAFLLLLALSGAAFPALRLPTADWLHALTFTMNYHQRRSWWTGHLWSLSVEEQFYLLWPAAVLVLGRRRSLWLAGSAVAIAPAWRVCVWVLRPGWRQGIGETFPTVMDAIAVGCVLAGCATRLAKLERYRRFQSAPWFVVIPVAVLACNALDRYPSFFLPVGMTLRNLGIALIVHWAILGSNRLAYAVLESPPLRWTGRLSYSLYLWQQPFLNRHGSAILTVFPINLTGAVVCAILSFACIESPFLRLRGRFARRVEEASRVPRAARALAARA
jgi:peptidoglycan/LPS O-acetylase OafA/YrhL